MEVCKFREPNSHSNSRENGMKRKTILLWKNHFHLALKSNCYAQSTSFEPTKKYRHQINNSDNRLIENTKYAENCRRETEHEQLFIIHLSSFIIPA